MKLVLSFIILFLSCFFDIIDAHGRLLEPAARSSAWRTDPSYPTYYNDMVKKRTYKI
jgi:hypothetical protein